LHVFHHLPRRWQIGCHRFLADDRLAVSRREGNELGVGVYVGDNVHEVYLFVL